MSRVSQVCLITVFLNVLEVFQDKFNVKLRLPECTVTGQSIFRDHVIDPSAPRDRTLSQVKHGGG